MIAYWRIQPLSSLLAPLEIGCQRQPSDAFGVLSLTGLALCGVCRGGSCCASRLGARRLPSPLGRPKRSAGRVLWLWLLEAKPRPFWPVPQALCI